MQPADLFAAVVASVLLPNEPLLLAVSGGSDSMALLAAAAFQRRARSLLVATVDHGLRTSAQAEVRLVAGVAGRYELPFVRLEAPPGGAAGRGETDCRRRRHAALQELARRRGIACIAMAHHRDDAHETLLLHLLRGHRGDRALASIPSLRRFPGGGLLLRPFLCGPSPPGRATLAAFREQLGVPAADDPTNADRRIARNRLRAVLAEGRAPLDGEHLEPVRRAARLRLERRLLDIGGRLARGLQAEGLGACLPTDLLVSEDEDAGWTVEVLRLLALCLDPPRQLAPVGGQVRELLRLRRLGHGELHLAARPLPLRLQLRGDVVRLPDVQLARGDGNARVLAALAQTSLYL